MKNGIKITRVFGITKVLKDITINNKQIESGCKHLCWDCSRANAASDKNGGCEKVRDKNKKRLDDTQNYPFILDGVQTINGSDKVISTIVSGCENYVSIPRKKFSTEEISRLKASVAIFAGKRDKKNRIEEIQTLKYKETSDRIEKLHQNNGFGKQKIRK